MNRPKEDIVSRVLALVHSLKTLQKESLITNVEAQKIRNRISEIFETSPEIVKAFGEFQKKFGLTVTADKKIPQAIESRIPISVKKKLTKDELAIVEALLRLGSNGELVGTKDLVKAVYDENHDAQSPCPDKLKQRISLIRKKILGWGKIYTKIGLGFGLEIDAQ